MRILYENYQKVIIFSYDKMKGSKSVELKFKIYIDNDSKDDLYLLFSKIIVEKMIMMDH